MGRTGLTRLWMTRRRCVAGRLLSPGDLHPELEGTGRVPFDAWSASDSIKGEATPRKGLSVITLIQRIIFFDLIDWYNLAIFYFPLLIFKSFASDNSSYNISL